MNRRWIDVIDIDTLQEGDPLPRRGMAIREDEVFDDGIKLGTVTSVLDVRDYTRDDGVVKVYERVYYRPR
jgi:hypothetical protein